MSEDPTGPGKRELPEPNRGDAAHALVRGLLAGVLYFGGALAESFTWVRPAPFQRKLQSWMENVSEQLHLLEARQAVDLNQLGNYVPQIYLRRFADQGGTLAVKRLDNGQIFRVAPIAATDG